MSLTNMLDKIKQEGQEREDERLKIEREMKEKSNNEILANISDKQKWSYDASKNEYILKTCYAIERLSTIELGLLFKHHFNKEIVSLTKHFCRCDDACSCTNFIKFKIKDL